MSPRGWPSSSVVSPHGDRAPSGWCPQGCRRAWRHAGRGGCLSRARSFELPLVAQAAARSSHYDAVVCLGLLCGGRPLTSTTSASRPQLVWPRSPYRPGNPWVRSSDHRRHGSRPLRGPAVTSATRGTRRLLRSWRPWRRSAASAPSNSPCRGGPGGKAGKRP